MKKIKIFLLLFIIAIAAFVRMYKLNELPPSLYWEEAALGYDAYSILQTGKDHHGQPFPVVAFTSFGDFKPSGYFYAIVPAIAMFGLNEWSVRLPSAFAGVLLVIVGGLLARRLVDEKQKDLAQLLAMVIMTFLPWAIQFSRAGWEVNLATCSLSWGMYFGLNAWEKNKNTILNISYSILTFVLLSFSMYTYHATRLIAPILALILLVMWIIKGSKDGTQVFPRVKEFVSKNFKFLLTLFVTGLFFLLLISPLLISSRDKTTQQRFTETSLFSSGEAVRLSNYYREMSGNSVLSRVLFHRYIFDSKLFIQNYFTHFSPQFLFISGDKNPRHSIQFFGLLYPIDALFLILGMYFLLKKRPKDFAIFWAWLIIGIIPAALTQAAPHALRTLPVMPVVVLILTAGVLQLIDWDFWRKLKFKKEWVALCVSLVILVQFGVFWRFYSTIYPKIYASEWQYGYKQMVSALSDARAKYPELPVYVTREYGRPAMYYWFYTQTDPRLVQGEDKTAPKDQGEFLEYQNMHFVRSSNEAQAGLVATTPAGMAQLSLKYKHTTQLAEIKGLQNDTLWVISVVGE